MRQNHVRLALCGLLVLIGVGVLVGWVIDSPVLKGGLPGMAGMKANGGLCFVLVGIGLAAAPSRRRDLRAAAVASGLLAGLIGVLTMAQYVLQTSFGIDEALIGDPGPYVLREFPGRMAPLLATAWIALGPSIVLLAIGKGARLLTIAHALALYAAFVAFLGTAGHAFDAEMLQGIRAYTPIALQGAVGLVAASVAALLTRSEEGWLSSFVGFPGARGLLFRLLPMVILLPILLGVVLLLGAGRHAYSMTFGFVSYIPLIAAALIAVVLLVATEVAAQEGGLRESESDLQAALAELRALNDSLERQVAERTQAHEDVIRQLHEAQKMETLGRLTGGVAHDFNNLLTPIMGALEILARLHRKDDQSARMIDTASHAADRARLLVERMLTFARRQKLATTPIDVGLLIHGMEHLLARSLGPSVRILVEQEGERTVAIADQSQLELALLNLAVNAGDAMPDGGTLTFRIGETTATRADNLAPGDYVRIVVEDTGHGMDAETAARAVEPFFSTKEVGRGTGLGLSMVDGLCAQLGGTMKLSSQLGVGTRVELWLPATLDEPRNEQKDVSIEIARPAGGSKLLLVDDEDLVRTGVAEMLTDLGYEVMQAASVREANQLLADGIEVKAVITDYLMPHETGADLIEDLAASHPGLPVLLITGHANAMNRIPVEIPRLSKPFKQAELAEVVRRLIESRDAEDGSSRARDAVRR